MERCYVGPSVSLLSQTLISAFHVILFLLLFLYLTYWQFWHFTKAIANSNLVNSLSISLSWPYSNIVFSFQYCTNPQDRRQCSLGLAIIAIAISISYQRNWEKRESSSKENNNNNNDDNFDGFSPFATSRCCYFFATILHGDGGPCPTQRRCFRP